MIWEKLGLFGNSLSADNKYCFLNRDSLHQYFHMQLSHKEKIFCNFFVAFSKFRVYFEHFQKNDDPHS